MHVCHPPDNYVSYKWKNKSTKKFYCIKKRRNVRLAKINQRIKSFEKRKAHESQNYQQSVIYTPMHTYRVLVIVPVSFVRHLNFLEPCCVRSEWSFLFKVFCKGRRKSNISKGKILIAICWTKPVKNVNIFRMIVCVVVLSFLAKADTFEWMLSIKGVRLTNHRRLCYSFKWSK